MNWLDKVLIFVASLVLAILGITLILLGLGVDFWNSFAGAHDYLATNALVSFLVGAVLCIIGFYLAGNLLGDKEEEVGIVAENEIGKVNIAERVIKAYAERAAQSVEGVTGVKSKIKSQAEGLSIVLDLSTNTSVKTADTAKHVQERVMEYVSDSLGTKVTSVEVIISSVEESKPHRVS